MQLLGAGRLPAGAASDCRLHARGPPQALDERQKELVRLLQEGLPLVREPFAELARQLGRPVSEVLEQLSDWIECGLIRRFGAAAKKLVELRGAERQRAVWTMT